MTALVAAGGVLIQFPGPAGAAGTAPAPPATVRPAAAVPSGYTVFGVDVSNHQGTVNWDPVVAAGRLFAYVKATEGTYYVDPYFNANYNGAKAHGLYAGAYHYARPDQSGGAAQADYFLNRAQYRNDGRTMLPMLDIEWPWAGSGSPYPCYGLSPVAMSTWISDFVARVKARTGQRTMIYTNRYWWNPCTGGNTTFAGNPLFVANYTGDPYPLPAGWSRWTLWQYSSVGALPGDQDVYHGTRQSMVELTGGTPAATAQYLVTGDWDGNGTVTPGLVRAEDGVLRWYLRNSNTSGPPDLVFTYGNPPMVPLVGDWDGNGTTTPGVVRAENGVLRWYLRDSNTTGVASRPPFSYGDWFMRPLAGDWDGNGTDTPGATDTATGLRRWHLRNTSTTGVGNIEFVYGDPDMTPLVGDWDGNRTTTPGAVRAENGVLRWYLRASNTTGVATTSFRYGDAGMVPIAGDWEGNRTGTPGAVWAWAGGLRWFLRNTNTGGYSDVAFDFGYPLPLPAL